MVSVAGREFEVRIVSDVQFHALPIKDDGEDDGEDDSPEAEAIPADLAGQTVFLLERVSDFEADFVSLTVKPRLMGTCSANVFYIVILMLNYTRSHWICHSKSIRI